MRSMLMSGAMALCAVIAVLGAPTISGAVVSEPSIPGLMTVVSVRDARSLMKEAGAHVQTVAFDGEDFLMTATVGAERHVWFEGMDCAGKDEAMACPEFKISARWDLDTPAHAEALARQLNYNYSSVHADGVHLELWRMEVGYAGITRAHLLWTIREFLDLRSHAEAEIWPTKKAK